MKRFFIIGIAAGLFAALASASDRQLDQLRTVQALNGSPQYLGTIKSSDGGCFNNLTNQVLWDGGLNSDGGVYADGGGTNAAAFVIPPGSLTLTTCDGVDVRWRTGTGTGTIPLAGQSIRLSGQVGASSFAVGEKHWAMLQGTENAIGICPLDGGTAEGCKIFRVR